jgi:hypothetical protein
MVSATARGQSAVMKVSQRLDLIDRIGSELQKRYSFGEIDSYLAAFDIPPPEGVTVNSKRIYAATALRNVALPVIAQIVDDLDMGPLPGLAAANPPANWKGTTDFRLFISHISKDRQIATRLKECLAPYAIAGFVAHEDIHPTLAWQEEIERALFSMDAMVAVHTVGFSLSNWTQQEIGFALGRSVKVISFKKGEDPTGFISRRQALARGTRTAEEIAKEIDRLLRADPLTASRIEAATLDDEIPF